jgi:hypothetical protein
MLQLRCFQPRTTSRRTPPRSQDSLDTNQSCEYILRIVPFRRALVQGGFHAHHQRRKKLLSLTQARLQATRRPLDFRLQHRRLDSRLPSLPLQDCSPGRYSLDGRVAIRAARVITKATRPKNRITEKISLPQIHKSWNKAQGRNLTSRGGTKLQQTTLKKT